jgi:pimeloyl-ACP methyl ester carboxylesterase
MLLIGPADNTTGASNSAILQQHVIESSLSADYSRQNWSLASGERIPMKLISRNGVLLAYTDEGVAAHLPSILLVHGWGCDHTVFDEQVRYFSKFTRVVAVDLRGHGESDAPSQDYTMLAYAEDLAFLIQQLSMDRPVLIGHSMGGSIGLECAARFPGLLGALLLIDSVLFPSQQGIDSARPLLDALGGPHWKESYLAGLRTYNLPTDGGDVLDKALALLPHASQQVLLSSLTELIRHDAASAARACKGPVAYIGSTHCPTDLSIFRSFTAQLVTAQVLGAGHFCPLLVPDQINAMIARLLALLKPE